MKMRWKHGAVLLVLMSFCGLAWADQIVLKNGREYSGKLVRADANVVEFRVQGRIETFRTADVEQIVFREPEMVNPPTGRSMSSTAEPGAATRPPLRETPAAERDSRTAAPPRQSAQDAPSGPSITLPAGTELTVRMADSVDTDRNHVGDTFLATLQDPISVGSQVIIPRGTEIVGTIAYANQSGRVTGQSELILELTELRLNGRNYPLQTSDYSEVGSSRGRRTATAAGGTAALGAIIGAIAGGGKGAAIGAATGAAAGAGVAVLTKGQTIKVPAETMLDFRLQKPLTIDLP